MEEDHASCLFKDISVGFVLAPQHKTSYDPKITTKEDFDN